MIDIDTDENLLNQVDPEFREEAEKLLAEIRQGQPVHLFIDDRNEGYNSAAEGTIIATVTTPEELIEEYAQFNDERWAFAIVIGGILEKA